MVSRLRIRIWDGIHRMGQPVDKLAGSKVDVFPTKRREPVLGLDRFPSVVEGQKFLEVSLYHGETGVDGRVSKAVGEEGEVGEAWVRVVGVVGLDVAGSSDCSEHGLELRYHQSVWEMVREGSVEEGRRRK